MSNHIPEPQPETALRYTRNAQGALILDWTGEGAILQEASSLLTPWTDIIGAAAPFTINEPKEAAAKFYRLRMLPD